MAGARKALGAKKIRRAGGTRRISPTSFRGWWPEPGGGAWPRTRCRPQSPVPECEVSGIGGESAETMIPPASQSKGELVHIARSIRNHFTRSLDRRARTKIAATGVTRQAAPTTGRRNRRCAGNAIIYSLPRRNDIKVRARRAQLYRGKRPTSKRMDRLYEGL
jgi:hypothetical protein